MKEKILNFPNMLSFLRILIAPFVFYILIISEYFWIGAILVFIAFLTDIFDGFFARQFNQETKIGRYLDLIADTILFWPCLAIIMFKTNEPKIFFVILSLIIVAFLMALFYLIYLYLNKRKTKRIEFSKIPYAEFGAAFIYFGLILFFVNASVFIFSFSVSIIFYFLAFFISFRKLIKYLIKQT